MIPKNDFPTDYDPNTTTSVDIPIALIPILAGLISMWEWRASWQSESDWQAGQQAAYLLQERLMTGT